MAFNVELIRKDFPSLATGIAFFDGPGGSQVPVSVGGAIAKAITQASSNRGTTTLSEQSGARCSKISGPRLLLTNAFLKLSC